MHLIQSVFYIVALFIEQHYHISYSIFTIAVNCITVLLIIWFAIGPFSSQITCEEALQGITDVQEQLTQLKQQEATLRRGLNIFKIDQPPSKEIQQMDKVNIRNITTSGDQVFHSRSGSISATTSTQPR